MFARFFYIATLVVSLTAGEAMAQTDTYVFTEKWPVNTKIVPSNAVSEYFRANFGKLGEIAAGKLDKCFQDAKCRAKLSKRAADLIVRLYNDQSKSSDQKAKELIAAIEADLGVYASPPSPDLHIVAKYAPSFGVARLTWDRQVQRLSCQKTTCTCPTGFSYPSTVVVPVGQYCYYNVLIGGVNYPTSSPPSCANTNQMVDVEAAYKIFRNGKLIAQFDEARKTISGTSLPLGHSFDFLTLKLSAVLPSTSELPTGAAGPFFDYDPQFAPIGSALTYRVEAHSDGCGTGYNNSYTGIAFRSDQLNIDTNGNGIPDFYPATAWNEKLAQMPDGGSGSLALNISKTSISNYIHSCENPGKVAVGTTTVSPVNGVAPYTVVWTGNSSFTHSGGLSPTFYWNGGTSATYKATVTDSAGKVGTKEVKVGFTWDMSGCGA